MLTDRAAGSLGPTWYNWLESSCAPANAAGIPIAAPSDHEP